MPKKPHKSKQARKSTKKKTKKTASVKKSSVTHPPPPHVVVVVTSKKHRSRKRPHKSIGWLPDFSSVLKQLAPYLCCGGLAILVIYLVFTYLSDAVCGVLTSVPLVGAFFSSPCGGGSMDLGDIGAGLLGAAGQVTGQLVNVGGVLVSSSPGSYGGVTDVFSSWP
jgi:hypothetical protein